MCLPVVYLADDDSPSEPDIQFIPDTPSLASIGGDPLVASMMLLKDGLDTGTTVAQFEVCLPSAVSQDDTSVSELIWKLYCITTS